MGVLYYFNRDDTRERFALNKAQFFDRGDDRWFTGAAPIPAWEEWTPFVEPDVLVQYESWMRQLHERLLAWSGGRPVRMTSDHDEDSCDWPITGSAYSKDYDDAGRYIPGSAW